MLSNGYTFTCRSCGATKTVQYKRDIRTYCGEPCRQQDYRQRFKGSANPNWQRAAFEEAFWALVRREGACWEWQGRKFAFGHGQFYYHGHDHMAHRVAYELSNGPIPPGLFVCHSCDNPPCCNPSHLWVGTHRDNMADMVMKGRKKVLRGESHPLAKLTEAQVRWVKENYQPIPGRITEMARQLAVSRSAVSLIVRSKEWRHIVI